MATKQKGFLKNLKKGALHKTLGVKPGAKIPAAKIASAKNSANPLTAKRAQFALNAAKWNKGGGKKKSTSVRSEGAMAREKKNQASDAAGKRQAKFKMPLMG